MKCTLADWANIATIVGTILALLALGYTAFQIKLSRKVNQATFWLELRKMFAEHNEIHIQLRGGNLSAASLDSLDWPKVEAYMGLLEHCKLLLDERLIDWKTFRRIYGYRVGNIISSALIVHEKLIVRSKGWEVFLQLVHKLGFQNAMLETSRLWLSSSGGQEWLSTNDGQDWLGTADGKLWKRIGRP